MFVGVQVGTPAGPLCRPCSVPERLCGRARAVISTEKQSILLREFYRIGLSTVGCAHLLSQTLHALRATFVCCHC